MIMLPLLFGISIKAVRDRLHTVEWVQMCYRMLICSMKLPERSALCRGIPVPQFPNLVVCPALELYLSDNADVEKMDMTSL